MVKKLSLRLGTLLFLQYFMMGAWFVPFGTYMSKGLHFDRYIGLAFGSQGVATIVSALAVGTLADRFFSSQRLLAALFLLSALALLLLTISSHSVGIFLLLTLFHFLFFIPTIPLANSTCLRWLPNPAVQFPYVRAFGTLGWIASGLLVGVIAGAAETRLPLLIGAAVGVVLSAYTLTLPSTPPPQRDSKSDATGLGYNILRRQADRSFWTLIVATLLIALPMAFYYAYCNNFLNETGVTLTIFGQRFEATAIQSLGQGSELLFLLLLPWFLRAFRIRGVFMLGIASWVARYALFAAGFSHNQAILWMLITGVLLHGAANDFIQVAGQLHVNSIFQTEVRARAQAIFTTTYMGVGAVVGSVIANFIYSAESSSSTEHDWPIIWLIPAGAAAISLIWFGLRFRPPTISAPGTTFGNAPEEAGL